MWYNSVYLFVDLISTCSNTVMPLVNTLCVIWWGVLTGSAWGSRTCGSDFVRKKIRPIFLWWHTEDIKSPNSLPIYVKSWALEGHSIFFGRNERKHLYRVGSSTAWSANRHWHKYKSAFFKANSMWDSVESTTWSCILLCTWTCLQVSYIFRWHCANSWTQYLFAVLVTRVTNHITVSKRGVKVCWFSQVWL